MTFHVLIPARLASTRLPRKPLADIAGVPMIVRVARQAAQSGAQSVTVAADDAEIVAACTDHGVESLLTRSDHESGSDRLAEACVQLGLAGAQIVVNVQGDEPLIAPASIDAVAGLLASRADCVMSTAAHLIADAADFADVNVVKVVLDARQRALYFSRAPIPWPRDAGSAGDAGRPGAASALAVAAPLRHVGLYAYHAAFLRGFAAMPRSPLENVEKLEQLRALWHGHGIAVLVSDAAAAVGVDTPADLDRVRRLFADRD